VSLDHLHERNNDFDYGRKLAGSFLQLAHRPTALLALNDEIAIGALRGLQEAGLKLPRDMSVTGFNNQPIARMTTPTLTTVNQNIDDTIGTAAEILLAQLDAPPKAKPIVRMIAGELVLGESTGPARAG
jgi:DNA-binding LacI/PurR family transcriptional regulator